MVIYDHAKGKIKATYSDPTISEMLLCGYDDKGNLFVNGFTSSSTPAIAELPHGAKKFTDLTLNQNIASPGGIQWDGKYMSRWRRDDRHDLPFCDQRIEGNAQRADCAQRRQRRDSVLDRRGAGGRGEFQRRDRGDLEVSGRRFANQDDYGTVHSDRRDDQQITRFEKKGADVFEGRVALVTGGARGIGAAITEMLAANGASVAAGFSRGQESAKNSRGEWARRARRFRSHQGRVDSVDDCNRVVSEVMEKFGRVHYLINNAGITVDKTVRKMSVEDWRQVLDVNLSGAFQMTKAVLEHMIERGSGRIVNISSVIGETGNVGQANYAASKAGLMGFTKSLALEMAQKGITVNCVAPGFIATEMVSAIPEAALAKVIEKIPQRRLGKPDEVARVVRFLLEDESSYITGAVYDINGGLICNDG